MTTPEWIAAEVLRLYHAEKWKRNTIARQLGIHHSAVERILARNGARLPPPARTTKVERYLPLIRETLERYPTLCATRLLEMCRARGYAGQITQLRAAVRRLRPRAHAVAYLRLRTLPGEQAQVDWADFGAVQVGRARRKLMAFVMVLSWSRAVFVRFFHDARMPNFLAGHVRAFAFFGGVARVVLYDNLKSAVLERQGTAIRLNPMLVQLAGHYRYEPRAVAPPAPARPPTSASIATTTPALAGLAGGRRPALHGHHGRRLLRRCRAPAVIPSKTAPTPTSTVVVRCRRSCNLAAEYDSNVSEKACWRSSYRSL